MYKAWASLLVSLFFNVIIGSAAYGQQPRTIFSASFENGAGAEIAGGDLRSVNTKKNFEFPEGISGRSILVGPETPLVYNAVKNIDPNAGTLSFWVQPVDWNVKKKGWYPLFWLGTAQGNATYYFLFLNVLDSGSDLSLHSRCNEKENTAQMFSVNSELLNVFKQGEWTHVVCTWSNWQCFLYINGKQTAQFSYGLPFKPLSVPKDFMLWFAGTTFWGNELNYRTRIDQIEIYDSMLTASQVREKYLSTNSSLVKAMQAPVVPIPRSDKKIVVDGRVTPEEWSDASQVPLNKHFFQLQFVSRPAWCQLKYDDVNLYVAVDIETPNSLLTPGSGRDMKVFKGDCFEILMRPPGYQGKDDHFIQLGIGANGAWAFFKNGKWNEATAIQKAVVVTNRGWSAEIAIPLTELYVKPVPGDPWLIQLAVDCPSEKDINSSQDQLFAWSGTMVSGLNKYTMMYKDPEVMGRAVFQKDNTYFRIERSGNLNIDHMDLSIVGAGTLQSKVKVVSSEKTVLDRSSSMGASLAIKEKLSFLGPGLLTIEGTKKGQNQPVYMYQTLFNIKDPLTILPEFYADESLVELSLDATGLDDHMMRKLQGQGLSGEAEIVSTEKTSSQSAGSEFYGQTTFILKSATQKIKLPFKDLPPGQYRIVVSLASDDQKVTKDCLFERPNPEFLTKKYGVDRTVPAPWTPIQFLEDSASKGSTVKVIGRTYTFSDIGLPASAESLGQKVLSRPISFQATLNGMPQSFIAQSQKTQEKAGDKVVTVGTAKTQDGLIKMNWTRTIEFDGMILYQVELVPAAENLRLEGLKLKMVVPAESARYLMKPDCIVDWNKTGRHSSMPTNFFWLTGIKTGMDFFTPDDGNWVYNEKNPPVSIVRKDQEVELICRFITRPVRVSKPLRYTFGFMATPVKPLQKNWRAVHVNGWGNPKGQVLQDYWCYDEKSQRIQFPNLELLTELTYEKEGMEEIAEWHAKGIKIVPVALHQSMPDNNPYYDYYGTLWASTMNGRPFSKSFRSKWQGKEFYMCSPACPASEFSDFLCWCVDRMVNKYGFDGVYLDGSNTMQCDNTRHGCGFVDAFGRQIHPWNDMGSRESFKRMYKIIHKKVPDGFLYIHCQAMLAPHVDSLVDLVLPGEDLMPNVPGNPNYYTDSVPLERWQSTYNIANVMGTMATFLGLSQPLDFPLTKAPDNPNISRPLMTMCLLHDINLFGNFIYYKTIEKYWQVLDETGISSGEAEFIGYWYPEAKIKADNSKVLVSYYQWPDAKKTVLIVGNPSPQALETQLKIPAEFLRSGCQVKDAFTGNQIDLTKPVKLEDRSFVVVIF